MLCPKLATYSDCCLVRMGGVGKWRSRRWRQSSGSIESNGLEAAVKVTNQLPEPIPLLPCSWQVELATVFETMSARREELRIR